MVVGGGYSGVETAREILDLIYESARYYRGLDKKDMRVVLIHSRERILHTLGDSLGDYAARKLRKRGLEIILEERVRAVTSSRVYLQSGATIETNTVISTVGNAPNKAIQALCNTSEIQHDHFRLLTDEYLAFRARRTSGRRVTAPSFPSKGNRESCPQTAQFAMREGICLADNIGLLLRGKALKPFTFKGLGELASIGHRTAVASIMGMQFSGFVAWFLWRTIYLSKLPGLDRKLRIMIDWTLDLFFPRDINLLSPRYTKLFKQVHLEPDDILFNRGEPGFSLMLCRAEKSFSRTTRERLFGPLKKETFSESVPLFMAEATFTTQWQKAAPNWFRSAERLCCPSSAAAAASGVSSPIPRHRELRERG